MYSICKQTHLATGVEHALTCNFFHRGEKSLVVASANVIRVFRLMPDVDPNRREKFKDSRPPKMKLECLSTYTLFGNVMSVQSVGLAGSARDSLLLSFRDAKLSVVEYDPEAHDLRTLSLHYFEEEDMKGGWTHNHHVPAVRVDPEGRCAVMLAYGRKLVVLPFRRETSPDDPDPSSAAADARGRAPVLASYTIVLKELDEKMDNVLDVQFLHGYYEPTLLILYEPVKTFPGRIAVRKDTCAMVAISLNIQQRVHPIIWSVSNLPFDCTQAIPVRKPLGGTLIVAINSLIYLNQSVPPFGVSLNSIAETSTSFPLKIQEDVKLTMEGMQAAFICPDKLVMSLKSGELYVLSLYADSMRSIRSFHFEKAAASVLTTCMCLCEDNYLFLGSRLGNSLLLHFVEKEQSSVPPGDEALGDSKLDQPAAKKKRMDTLGDWMASDVADIRDVDELEVYGSEAQTSVHITSYVFEVCDSLLNIGPCGNISMGEPAFLSEEFSSNDDPDIELFTTSGYGKNGALCVLQRSIRPQVVTTFELPGCVDMWTVLGSSGIGEPSDKGEQEYAHSFMILSQRDSTMVLQTGQEINEVDHSGFSTQGSTVYAGNLGYNRFVVQVSQLGVRLLQGVEQVQHIPLDLGSPVVHASCADPHMVIHTEDGQVLLLTLREARGQGRLAVSRPSVPLKPQIVTLCAYRDVSGLFSSTLPDEEVEVVQKLITKQEPDPIKKEVDDEDKMLYGDPDPGFVVPMTVEPLKKVDPAISEVVEVEVPWWRKRLQMQEVKPTYWLFLVRENGSLELYTLPDFQLSYVVRGFGHGHRVLANSLEPSQASPAGPADPSVDREVQEILMVALGHHGSRPVLLARLDDELLLYQAYRYPKGSLKLRFRRLTHSILPRERSSGSKMNLSEDQSASSHVSRFRYFSNIAGYNGVFICGPNPHWLFLTSRGELRTHPMGIDGPVTCFAPFHNVNCPQGFLYFNKKGELRICVLPTHLSYDAPWPVRKVPLRCTPHFATYHLESKTYCVVTSQAEPTNKYYRFNGEDKELTIEERNERFSLPLQERFSVLLFSPVSWEIIPNTKMELDEWEHVTCLKNVSLSYEGATSGFKGYIAVGTNYNYGEDVTSRGRILIFDIIEVVPEPGQPLTKNRFKMVYSKEQKGPVTALSQVLGFLVSAVGQKIYIWQLKDSDLVGVAFIDTNIYIHQLLSIKSLILVADVFKSISLLRFQEEYRTLSLVSRDFRPAEIYTCEFLIDNSQLGFVVADSEKNFVLYMYQPEARESVGGQRLLRKADFHLGQHVNTFFRIRCRLPSDDDTKHLMGADKRHISMFATLDGGLGYLLPVPEKTYRRLLMLQNVLANHISHTAGLNPKAFRTYTSSAKLLSNPARGVIDGELVWQFLGLPLPEKQEVAKKIGTRVDEIVDDLADVETLTAHF
ncbi:cleavage and polyadenylation specificity factor subunit 1 [Bacillus rossius redtenbacheri]|uniref:cleavage and polyadenylation specificity factor subunit 1 n=1 Tax=Bacillus rossius redtenbacheri TaxID=93214 RepID=UPI002FDDA5A4